MLNQKIKVFIIEDDINILSGLKAKLSVQQYQVISLSSGRNAIELIKENKPNIIILDLILPDLDGFELLQKIKKDKEIKNIPIVIYTNLSDKDSKSKGIELGIKHYLTKVDYRLDDIVDKVKQILKNGR